MHHISTICVSVLLELSLAQSDTASANSPPAYLVTGDALFRDDSHVEIGATTVGRVFVAWWFTCYLKSSSAFQLEIFCYFEE
jgi:hypothetical protein